MGLHAELLHHTARPPAVDRGRAVLTLALVALAPEGRAGAGEIARLRQVVAAAPMLVDLPSFAVADLLPRLLGQIARRGPERVLDEIRHAATPGVSEAALAIAIRSVAPGGRLPPRMAARIGRLAELLGAEVDVLADLLGMLRMLDRPA